MTPELGLLTVVTLAWTLVEGRTILIATGTAMSGGAARTDRLGWGFLGTEAWTLALLGLVHALTPAAVHEVYGRWPWAPVVFVAGWMARDLGLWFRRREGAGRAWDVLAAAGASGQLVGGLAVLGGFATLRPGPTPSDGADLLVLVAPPVLVVGALLQRWLHHLGTRDRGAAPVPPRATTPAGGGG